VPVDIQLRKIHWPEVLVGDGQNIDAAGEQSGRLPTPAASELSGIYMTTNGGHPPSTTL
jgi:hypothetical protein